MLTFLCLLTEYPRIHYFPCYNMASARKNNSPYSSLCNSLHWYLILSYVYFLKMKLSPINIYFFWVDGQEWLTSNLEIAGVMNSLFSVYGIFINSSLVNQMLLFEFQMSYNTNLVGSDIYDDLISRRVNSSDAEKFAEVCPCPCNGVAWGVIW